MSGLRAGERPKSFGPDEANPKKTTIDPAVNAAIVTELKARNRLEVPSDETLTEVAVAADVVDVDFVAAEVVKVTNKADVLASGPELFVWFKKPGGTTLGPFEVLAYASEERSSQFGFIGVQLLSTVSGTTAQVEAKRG